MMEYHYRAKQDGLTNGQMEVVQNLVEIYNSEEYRQRLAVVNCTTAGVEGAEGEKE